MNWLGNSMASHSTPRMPLASARPSALPLAPVGLPAPPPPLGIGQTLLPGGLQPPGPKKSGLLGFFDEPSTGPGEVAKTELFQKGQVPHWLSGELDEEEESGATEIFSAHQLQELEEGFSLDEPSLTVRKRG